MKVSWSVGREIITRTDTGTHTPCIQTGSTLFPFQAAFEILLNGGSFERKLREKCHRQKSSDGTSRRGEERH
jgi:hypothetical protein